MPKGIHADQSVKHKLLHRLKIARGHLDSVISMIDTDKNCIDIINQSTAVQKALKETDQLLLKNHLENCVGDVIKKGNFRSVVEEITKILDKSR